MSAAERAAIRAPAASAAEGCARGNADPAATAARRASRACARAARIAALARVEALCAVRDRTSIGLLLVVPALQIALFGYAVRPDVRDVPLAIAREQSGPADRLRRAIDRAGAFSVVADGLAAGGAEEMVRAGRARIGIELPRVDYFDPDAPVTPGRIFVDASEPASVQPALAALEVAWWRDAARRAAAAPPAEVETVPLHNPERRSAWAIVPGLAGVVVMISMLLLGALTLVRERERGTWEALLATPVTGLDALAGKLAPYVAVGTLQAVVVLAVGHALFEVPLRGAVWALVLAAPLYAAAHLILGFAFSALAESALQALQGAVLFYLPSMLLSGFLFPFEGMPGWARAIGEVLPLTHFVRAARGVLLRGDGAARVLAETAWVAAFAVVASAAALAAYRRRLD